MDQEAAERPRKQRRQRTRGSGEKKPEPSRVDRGALAVFALLVALAPLAFGAVDRVVQIGLLSLFALGLYLKPPEVVALSRRAGWVVLLTAALLAFKEFLPAAFFGAAKWRTTLTESYGLVLPWTHNPEPGRALDSLFTGAVAVLWFLWVRTLSGNRENRPLLAWSLFGAAVLVAAVSFATKGGDPRAIYGWRYTPGWRGFGPFPNRNHTASLLAMGALVGFGCIAWSGARKRYWLLAASIPLAGLPVAGLMVTQSRGGLLGFAVGCAVFILLLLCKLRSKRALALIATAALAGTALLLDYGAPLFARFTSPASEVSNLTRVNIWTDATHMWEDAPLLGHGAGAFASIFPLYQELQLDNQVVLHPESSWLQWLTELGLLPMLLLSGGAVVGLLIGLQGLFGRQHNFYLMAGGLAAGAALLSHALIDVPAHRWATAGFALAAVGLALPVVRLREAAAGFSREMLDWPKAARRAAWVPLSLALFWSLPFLLEWPRWSPQSVNTVLDHANGSAGVSITELDSELSCFPLQAQLHQLRGFHELLRVHPREEVWMRHFRIAQRLLPSSWALALTQARACLDFAPSRALSFWQQAIERGGLRNQELFGQALEETRHVPGSAKAWATYVEAHPELALAYARTLPEADGKKLYDFWWQARGSRPEAAMDEPEIRIFYDVALRWGSQAQFAEWMRYHSLRVDVDYRRWAALLHGWKDDDVAWDLLAKHAQEPAWPSDEPLLGRAQMELRWQHQPQNMMNAQALATSYYRAGELEAARAVVVKAAGLEGAPAWFIRKGAYQLLAEGKLSEAVALLLKEEPPTPL